jgi:hypothetical protein
MTTEVWSKVTFGRLIGGILASLALFGGGTADAQERLGTSVLELTVVSLDASQWALDEEKAESAGHRFFYADHEGGAGEISIHVSELKSGDSGRPLEAIARDFLKGIQQKSKHFVERPCPKEFQAGPGWFCAAYESTILTPVAETLTVMHVTSKDGYTIYKKAKYPIKTGSADLTFAADALRSVVLKP